MAGLTNNEDGNGIVADTCRIMECIPHRYPFLLVDKITEFKAFEYAVGVKGVSASEPHFQGHFPHFPIMPGVLIIESMAQTGAMMAILSLGKEFEGKDVYFMGVDNAKFRRPVLPGDMLHLHLTALQMRKSIWKMQGIAKVNDKIVAEAQLTALIKQE